MAMVCRLVAVTLLIGAVTSLQSFAQSPGDRVTVIANAPIVLLPDANRTPLAMAAKGSSLILVKDEGAWLQVRFQDPRLGLRTGYIQKQFTTFQRTTEQPLDLSVPVTPPSIRTSPTTPIPTPSAATGPAKPSEQRPVAQDVQMLTEAEVEQAIALGTKSLTPNDYMHIGNVSTYGVIVLGRLGRIAITAYEADRQYKPITATGVAPELKRDEVSVQVIPNTPTRSGRSMVVPTPVTHVVLRDASGVVVQPTQLIPRPYEWTNALGGRFSSVGAMALFRAFPAGDFDIIIVTQTSERVHRVQGTERAKLQ